MPGLELILSTSNHEMNFRTELWVLMVFSTTSGIGSSGTGSAGSESSGTGSSGSVAKLPPLRLVQTKKGYD